MAYHIQDPYGLRPDGSVRCVNAEPGAFNHECNKPARWIGGKRVDMGTFYAAYCDDCRERGSEARQCTSWHDVQEVLA